MVGLVRDVCPPATTGAVLSAACETDLARPRGAVNATFIMGSYLPKRSPRAVQNARLVEALGWRGHLIVPRVGKLPAHKQLDGAVADGMRVHRIWDARASRGHRLLHKLGCQSDRLPDDMLPWALGAGSLAAVLPRPELLVTIGHPLSSHLAGLIAKRTTRHGTPWLAYFSDLWLDMEALGYVSYTPAVRAWNARLEAAVLRTADAIVVTNELTREILLRRFPRVAAKTHVVTQAFDERLFPPRSTPHPAAPRELVLRYLGDFYGPRSPRPILQAALEVQRQFPDDLSWRIELIGWLQCDDLAQCQALLAQTRHVVARGEVPYRESLQAMVDADALLVIDAPATESPFLPSKLVDYLGANRPLVGFTSPGTAAALIRRAGGLVADVADPRAVAVTLAAVIERWRCGRLAQLNPSQEVRAEFDRLAVSRRFDELAQRLVQTFRRTRGHGAHGPATTRV